MVLYNFYPGYRWFSPFGTKWNGEKDEDPGGDIGVGDATGSVWALLYEAEGICYVNRTLGTNYPRQLPYTTEQTTDSYIPEYMLPELVEARLELAQSVLRVWRTQEVPAWYRYSLSHNMNVLYYKLRHSASCLDPEADGD